MHFGTLAQALGLELLLDTPTPVAWVDAGVEARPELPRGAVWLARRVPDGLVAHLARVGAAGLWCGQEASEAVLAACRSHGLGLAVLPPWLSPETVLAEARGRVAEAEGPSALALAGMLEVLLTRMERERAVIETLYRWLGLPIALVSSWGQVLAWAGEVPRAHPRIPGSGPDYLALPAGEGLLVAYGHRAELERARGVLELAARLLKVRALEERVARAEEEGLRGTLLDDLLVGEADPERALAFGFDPLVPYVLALVEPPPIPGRHRLAEARRREALLHLRREAVAYLERLGVAYLVTGRGGRAVILWQTHATEREVQALISALGEAVRVGYSATRFDLAEVPQAYREALIALKTARPGQYADFTRLDPVAWVLLQQSPEDLRALAERFLPLEGKLLRTLEVYLAHEGDLTRAAAELHVHPNTLRYRLGRIEAVLGGWLRSPEVLAQVYLALRARGLLEEG